MGARPLSMKLLLIALAAARAKRTGKTCRHHRRLADAPTLNATAAPAPPRVAANASLALLSVGQPRGVVEHPVIVRQFRLMRSGLPPHDLFLTLVGDGTLRKPTHRTAKQLKHLYGARGVEIEIGARGEATDRRGIDSMRHAGWLWHSRWSWHAGWSGHVGRPWHVGRT